MMLLRSSTVWSRPGGAGLLHRDAPPTEDEGTGLLVDAR